MSHSPEAPPKSDSAPQRICPLCGEANPPDRRECRNCAEPLPSAPLPAVPFGTPALVLVLALAWLALLIGLIYSSPGLAIVLVILTTPPVVRTVILAKKRAALGKETTVARTVEMSVMSFGMTVLIVSVGLLSAFVAFFALCLGVLASLTYLPGEVGTTLSIGLGIAAVCALLFGLRVASLFRTYVARRWNSDLNRK